MSCDATKPVRLTLSEFRQMGRNDSCTCGSERKFKKCCGLRSYTIHRYRTVKKACVGRCPNHLPTK